MAEETDKATEARRKALRNGEEDPVIVAQRFLNIYRQRHIFSAERKEEFDKSLLSLSPEIRGLFSGLPGGIMLQDYVDDLAEKNGVAKAVRTSAPIGELTEEAHQQAQILATALAQTQTQAPIQVAAPTTVSGKVSMDKDFAEELAKVLNSLMQQQTVIQQKSLEKLAQDLSKTQMFIAKMLKDGKDEQLNEISSLSKAIADSLKEGREEQLRELAKLCQAIVEGQKSAREEQLQELGVLCKTIAQSQTALSASLSRIGGNTASVATGTSSTDDSSTRQLIEVVLDGQKQLNSRLDKVEEISALHVNDNQQMLAAFEKSQAEIVKSLSGLSFGNLPVQTAGSEDRLAQIINESQEKLVQALTSGNFQQSNMAQSTNNSNNIQITAPDNSAQLLLLVDKIASLQASNEQNLENAITRAIEEQGRLYDKINRQQTKELAEIIAESLKEANRSVVYTMPVSEPQAVSEENNVKPFSSIEITEVGRIPPKIDDFEGFNLDLTEQKETAEPEIIDFTDDASVYEENEPSVSENTKPVLVEDALQTDDAEIFADAEVAVVSEEPKKKKKRKKKKKKKTATNEILAQNDDIYSEDNETEIISVEEDANDNVFAFGEADASDEISFDDISSEDVEVVATETFSESLSDIEPETNTGIWQETFAEPQNKSTEQFDVADFEPIPESGDDWGFSSSGDTDTPSGNNDNQEGEDWEWEYVENAEDEDYAEVDVIGGNSYIYSSDLYSQEKVSDSNGIIYGAQAIDMKGHPVIVDDIGEDETIDPYQNSILKD